MCKEDVRIGRKKTPDRTGTGTTAAGEEGRILIANPNRTAVVLMLVVADLTVANAVVFRHGSIAGPNVAVLTNHNPMAVLRVEDFGQAVTDELFYRSVVGVDDAFYATEIVILEPLDKV